MVDGVRLDGLSETALTLLRRERIGFVFHASQRYTAQLPAIPAFDVVVDFLWGRPTELLLRTLVPTSYSFPKPTRIIQVGESAGPQITVAAESLRTVEVHGAAKGLNSRAMGDVYGQIVAWAQVGELTFDVERVPLAGVESALRRTDLRGRRLVVVP